MRTERFTTNRIPGSALAIAALVLLTAQAANATSTTGSAATTPGTTGTASVPTQQIDGVTFPASFPAGALNQLRVTNVGAIPEASQGRPRPRNTTSITTDLYVPGKIQGVDGQPPLAHCRNLANGQRQCVTPAPAGGW